MRNLTHFEWVFAAIKYWMNFKQPKFLRFFWRCHLKATYLQSGNPIKLDWVKKSNFDVKSSSFDLGIYIEANSDYFSTVATVPKGAKTLTFQP